MSTNRQIVMIGAGNAATCLANAYYHNKSTIVQVYSRTMQSASELALQVSAEATDNLKKLVQGKYTYILALPDDVIVKVLPKINLKEGILIHCSGSLPMDILKNSAEKYGVIYPLISMNKSEKLDFNDVPFCVEGCDMGVALTLKIMVYYLSKKAYIMDSEQRNVVHLAAVFANNFPNFLYGVAKEILDKRNIPFDVLKPLICETAMNIMTVDPAQRQTGPAARNDKKIIENHLSLLADFPEYKNLYQLFSKVIMAKGKK